MRKVLYFTNIEVPYKVRFLNELSKKCDLTVVYERDKSANRDSKWAKSIPPSYKTIYLNGLKIGNENGFSLKILKMLNNDFDEIVISCINSPIQLLAIEYMKKMGLSYSLSFDGELFIGKGFKAVLKKYFIKGAKLYLTAGEHSASELSGLTDMEKVKSYGFSSLSVSELEQHKNMCATSKKKQFVLVVGQYLEYKGLDIALDIANKCSDIKFIFVGTGSRTDNFLRDYNISNRENIEVISFLDKEKLNELYASASCLLLPSRRECWGLVISEAASFGTPIIASSGSGAGLEYLFPRYKKYLFDIDDINKACNEIYDLTKNYDAQYSEYLIEKSKHYSIEKMVEAHVEALHL